MIEFSANIQEFERYGTYQYKFDDNGNLTFDNSSSDFSRVYLAIPLKNIKYNKVKIDSFFNPEFVEFVPDIEVENSETNEEIQQQVNVLEEENIILRNQLDELTNINNSSESDADQLAIKQVILELRKELGQGRVDSDFLEDFPYPPIRKDNN